MYIPGGTRLAGCQRFDRRKHTRFVNLASICLLGEPEENDNCQKRVQSTHQRVGFLKGARI